MGYVLKNKIVYGALCVVCGWISAFAMPNASLWPCLFVGLSGLYILYSNSKSAQGAFACGFLFALGYFVTGLWWIGNALLVEGNEFAWVWPISVIGLPTLLGLFTGTYLAIARIIKSPNTLSGFFIFALFLTFSEWARGNAFTGFPWNLYGYVWSDHLSMAQSFYYFGAYGYTFITVLWASMTGFLLIAPYSRKTKFMAAAVTIVSMASVFYLGQIRLEKNPTEFDTNNAMIVVQPNVAQNLKWDPVAIQNNFENIVNLSKDLKLPSSSLKNVFIVWPETAISPSIYTKNENMEKIRNLLEGYSGTNAYLVTGILRRIENPDESLDYANSIAIFNKSLSALEIYDKHHLVPFGEFIPLQNWIPLKPVAAFKGFKRGDGVTTIELKDIPSFSPLICYEIIFPGGVISTKTQRPKWIVNSTNDGWYGDSAGPHQHFAQTRLRAIEEGVPVIRSANTGVSGVIDSYGRTIEKADIFDEAALVSYLPLPIETSPPLFPSLFIFMMLIYVLGLMFKKIFLHKSNL